MSPTADTDYVTKIQATLLLISTLFGILVSIVPTNNFYVLCIRIT